MGPKCTDCYYCRRGAIATWEPAYTCLHPLSRELNHVARTAEACSTMRADTGACGPDGHLFRPAQADGPQPPLHMYRQ